MTAATTVDFPSSRSVNKISSTLWPTTHSTPFKRNTSILT